MTDAASLVASLLLDALAPSRPAPPVAPAYCSFETRESLVPLELTSLWCLISSPIPTPLPSPELLLKSPTTSSTQTASRSTTVAGSISSVGTGEGAGRRSSPRRSQTCRARREQWRSTRSVRFPRPSTGISYPWCGFWSSGSSLGTWLCARSITRSVIETTISAARRTGMRPTRTPVPTTLLASLLSGRRLWKECRAVVGKYLKSSARCRVSSSRFFPAPPIQDDSVGAGSLLGDVTRAGLGGEAGLPRHIPARSFSLRLHRPTTGIPSTRKAQAHQDDSPERGSAIGPLSQIPHSRRPFSL